MLSLKIALRFLRTSKAQTILIVLGLGIGIAVQVFVGSLLQNLQEGFLKQTTGNASHVTVLPAEGRGNFSDWQDIADLVESVDGVVCVSPSADFNALLLDGSGSSAVLVRGMEPSRAEGIYELSQRLYEGSLPANDSQALVGRELAEARGLGPGDSFTLLTPTEENHVIWVSGLYDLGSAVVNERWLIVSLGCAQRLSYLGDNVTSIESQTTSVFTCDATASDVEAALAAQYDVTVVNWKDANGDFFSALSAQGSSSYMIQTFVLMSVVIGIASVLSITVMQKSRQLGILKAMGIKDRQSSMIFLFEGLILGVGGAAVGVSLGAFLFYGFVTAISSSGDSIIATTFNIPFMVGSGAVAILAAMGASLVPALKSRKLDPIEVIRNG